MIMIFSNGIIEPIRESNDRSKKKGQTFISIKMINFGTKINLQFHTN